jgi:DNA-directed RNA polymerase alpha subunit
METIQFEVNDNRMVDLFLFLHEDEVKINNFLIHKMMEKLTHKATPPEEYEKIKQKMEKIYPNSIISRKDHYFLMKEINLMEAGLDIRTSNTLEKNMITTTMGLQQSNWKFIKSMENMGKIGIQHIEKFCKKHGLTIPEE